MPTVCRRSLLAEYKADRIAQRYYGESGGEDEVEVEEAVEQVVGRRLGTVQVRTVRGKYVVP